MAGYPLPSTVLTTSSESHNRMIKIEFKGSVKKVSEWAKEYGLPTNTLRWRINNGWKMSDAVKKREKLPEGLKKCSTCHEIKTLENFYKRKHRNGHLSKCKACYAKKTP